jgi:predicted AAA+ superfamily ATPase
VGPRRRVVIHGDEPTISLDVTTQSEGMAILDEQRRKRGLSSIYTPFICRQLSINRASIDGMLSERLIVAQNPWWTDPDGWEARDGHLRALSRQPLRLPAQIVDRIALDAAGIHVIRGPRQVGKSTELKLLAQRAIAGGLSPRSVVYLSLDAIDGQPHGEAADTVAGACALARTKGAKLLLLDEVTSIPKWQLAVKHLFDIGLTRDDVVVCTGSSAVHLRRGVKERLPGRRGGGTDHFVAPRSFAEFAVALDPLLPASPCLSPGELATPNGEALLHDALLHLPRLHDLMMLYLRFGGLPAAVAEVAAGALEPSAAVLRMVEDSVAGETLRRGASAAATGALLERVLRSLGAKTSWPALARDMGVPLGRGSDKSRPQPQTMRSYIEFLTECYQMLVLYFWRPDSGSSDLSRDKKLYFADPLLHSLALARAPGLAHDRPSAVENVVALALLRAVTPRDELADAFNDPSALHVWGTRSGGEIDFVCGPRREALAVEVAYQRAPDRRKAAALPKAFPGRPCVMVTRESLGWYAGYALVPAALFLWALG